MVGCKYYYYCIYKLQLQVASDVELCLLLNIAKYS